MRALLSLAFLCLISCRSYYKIAIPVPLSSRITGKDFYKAAAAFNWRQRDSFAVKEILSGNLPSFFKKFVAVSTSITDSTTGKIIHATYYVSPDYLSIGTNDDWARINMTPMAAQQIADRLQCFLPTKKMVDDIYRAALVKLEPVPMYAFRDSTPTMYQHHLIIEGQRKGRRGLIAGIKKDVVISGKITGDAKRPRVAIYGWHSFDSKAIQPLYTGHAAWYVDYSHGIRLIYRRIKVAGAWMDYMDVLKHPLYKNLLCDEGLCDFYKYAY